MGSRGIGLRLAALVMMGACSSGSLVLGRIEDDASAAPDAAEASDVSADAETCEPPPPARHYAFDGTGTEVADRRGGAPAHILGGAALDGTGILRLDGKDDYVDLPNGILAGLTDVSVAVWVRRLGGPGYTRIFDIGTSSRGEDPDGSTVGRSYLAATPATGFVPSGLAALMSQSGSGGEVVAASDVVLDQEMHLIVVVVGGGTLSIFYDGAPVARIPRAIPLSAVVDHNAWLGRSQYAADPYLTAEYADARIFGAALSDCAVRALFLQGPHPP